MTIFNLVMKRTFKNPMDVVMLLLLPIIVVFINLETWLYLPLGFQLYGIILMFMASKLCKTMMVDREKKVVLRIAAGPITYFKYLFENLLAYSFILFLVNTLVVVLGAFLYQYEGVIGLKLLVLLNVFSIASIGLSMVCYALFRHTETAYSILGGVYIAFAMLGGMLWPAEIMPILMQRAIQVLPTYWYIKGMQQVAPTGQAASYWLATGILLLFGVAFILVGSKKRMT